MGDVGFSVGANACVNGFGVLRRYRTVRAACARARRGYENLLAMADGDCMMMTVGEALRSAEGHRLEG